MSKRRFRLIISLIVFVVVASYQLYIQLYPSKKVLSTNDSSNVSHSDKSGYAVSKVVDGDTLDIVVDNKKVRVRILGINTPETVDPRKPVQCFGKEASDKAKSILSSLMVSLESDASQGDKDKYGRLLRYVYLPDGTDYGYLMIKEGYAYEYTYDIPYKKQTEYKVAQKEAEKGKVGLWADTSCSGKL